ncbi:MAG: MFS transporter [Acidimicrobiia bacterium]
MRAISVPSFRRLAIAWSFSNFGDSLLYLSLAIWVKDLTGSDAMAGLVFLFLGLPVFMAPLAGQLADRVPRRRLVIAANLTAAVGVLSLGWVTQPSDVWLIYAVTFGYGFLTYATSAAGSGLVRDMLGDDQLADGNGLLVTIDQALRLLSPLVGAGLYTMFGGLAVAIMTSVLLVAAALVMTTVAVEETSLDAPEERFWRELAAGFRHILTEPLLARITWSIVPAFAAIGLVNAAVFAIVDSGLGKPPEFFGILAAIEGAGSVVGGLVAAAIVKRRGERWSIALALVVLGAMVGALVSRHVVVVAAGEAAIGLAIPLFVVAYTTLRQRLTPARLQGRVAAATNMALNGPQSVGTAIGAALLAFTDYRVLLAVTAVIVVGCAVPVARASQMEERDLVAGK